MQEKFEELIDTYIHHQVGISDHFITKELSGQLQKNLLDHDKDNNMKFAGIGNQDHKDLLQDKRGDKILWMNNESQEPAERAFLNQIDQFILYLNDTCYVGINAYEFHYALYDTGSGYTRHVDQFKNNNDRKFSMIHYLNTDWLPDDGGELLIYRENEVEKISPEIQKAVFFKSDSCEHSVSKSTRPRMSISGWLKSI